MFEPGRQVGGRYEIQRRVGRGGMGTVFVAHDAVLGRLVAIKVFVGDLAIPDARERFGREARSAATLAHPHIVAVYDFGEHDGQPYIVMEYVPGETLAEVIRRKAPISIAEKLRWVDELAAGVGYAHQLQIIHRDIKPANLSIDRSGRLRILDFGIARMLGIASNTRDMIGTPGYMAPEQILGADVDPRADLFSIGVVFYELLSYTEAFPGDTLPTITHRILTTDPVPLPKLVPDLHPDVQSIIERLLKKNAKDRFADAESLRREISRVRRRLEEDSTNQEAAPTVIRRETPPPRGGSPGTGSARRPTGGMVGVATPPPVDREALARRRTAQIEAALAQARELLAAGDLEMALDACQQALTLDEKHAGALELEGNIRVAFAERGSDDVDAAATPGDDPGPLDGIDPPGVSGAEYAPTVLAPPRRTPAPPSQTVARPPAAPPHPQETIVPAKPARPSWFSGTLAVVGAIPIRVGAMATAVTSHLRSSLPVVGARARALVPTLAAGRPARRSAIVIGSAVAGILIGAIVFVLLRPAAVPPTGTLVIDAVPWGTITAVEAENGERPDVPLPASTPLSVALPAGTYQVLVAGPSPDSEAQRITVRVEPAAATVAPPVHFRTITPEEYFEPYLVVSPAPVAPASPPAIPAGPAAAPSPAPAPAGVAP